MATERWTQAQPYAELERWERELRPQGKVGNTISTYIGRGETFLRRRAGDDNPR